jgi:hypothetical protein
MDSLMTVHIAHAMDLIAAHFTFTLDLYHNFTLRVLPFVFNMWKKSCLAFNKRFWKQVICAIVWQMDNKLNGILKGPKEVGDPLAIV